MRRFDLATQTAHAYDSLSATQADRPVVGISANYGDNTAKLAEGYYKQVEAAGATPLLIPPSADAATLSSTLDHIDALLLSGGADINPLFQGEMPRPELGGINDERDLPELLLTTLAANRQMPILGICRGVQTMSLALGGRVEQHISTDIKHSQEAGRHVPTHTVELKEGSTLRTIYGGVSTIAVNSFHHQAVAQAGPHLNVTATSPDGVVEAVESSEHKPFLGVQWHPECMGADGLPLFRWLVAEAALYRKAQLIHDHTLTLDTHCDTPMFFNLKSDNPVNFATRNPRILVDLPKMAEGRLDATIMVAYLPQPKPGETFAEKVSFSGDGPRQYADTIFDRIEQIAAENSSRLGLACTPGQLWENKRAGRKSIMLGIENGLALEGDIANVEHFARRGVVYITLCHNGDNDICDSCRGLNTHGGLSDFGLGVVAEMNRLGLMVDLSHAADSSFYDALEASATPIVCSHSSCRSLCNHPRNLTDEQMKALATCGGVMQVTLYPGFLVEKGEATILDAMSHLDHAIRVMGIDHVGLGTDFDGDGGVKGLADASELTLFTRQLLSRRYSDEDIQKIWGGNFLRVMAQVQSYQKSIIP